VSRLLRGGGTCPQCPLPYGCANDCKKTLVGDACTDYWVLACLMSDHSYCKAAPEYAESADTSNTALCTTTAVMGRFSNPCCLVAYFLT